MKIEYREGNVFRSDIKHIVHGCNDAGVMGSGVALFVKQDFPEAYEQYVKKHRFIGLFLGEIQMVDSNGKTIINAITQKGFGRTGERFVKYDAIAECMSRINDQFYTIPNGKLAMPKIGAGLGGGDWNVIAAIIESELTSVQPVVYVYE